MGTLCQFIFDGAAINSVGFSVSWSDTLLDFISVVTTQRYMKTIINFTQNVR